MAKAPEGLPRPVTFDGTNFNDTITVDAAAYSAAKAAQSGNPLNADLAVYAKGGDDTIVRDRTGSYTVDDGQYGDGHIEGGGGFDVVSYAGSAYALTANLAQGIASSETPWNQPVAFGTDFLTDIEGIAGTAYDDQIIGSGDNNKIWGNGGNDALWGEGGADQIWGGAGADTIYGGSGNDSVRGDIGADTVHGGGGNDNLYGDAGNDTILGGSGKDMIRGGHGHDHIEGGNNADTIYGDLGGDTLLGGVGNDTIHVGAGHDTADGGLGADRIHISGVGNNDVDGSWGSDTVVFAGNDDVTVSLFNGTAFRSDGSDELVGIENVETGSGDDVVFGTSGLNVINTGGGSDVVYTIGGSDTVYAGTGNDTVVGYGGAETINGNSGNDTLQGNGGEDLVHGGAGEDVVDGGDGDDVLYGGTQADVFLWESGDFGVDTVRDFAVNEDQFAFGAGYFWGQSDAGFDVSDVLVAQQVGDDTVLQAKRAGVSPDPGLSWQSVAILEDTSAVLVNQKIANGTIFDVELSDVGSGGPGGFAGAEPDSGLWHVETGWDMLS